MARAGPRLSEVDARAQGLMDGRVVSLPRSLSVSRARRGHAPRKGAERPREPVGRRLEERSRACGLLAARPSSLAGSGLSPAPRPRAGAGEIAVRRRLDRGASLVLIREGRRIVGMVRLLPSRGRRHRWPPGSIASRASRRRASSGCCAWPASSARIGDRPSSSWAASCAISSWVPDLHARSRPRGRRRWRGVRTPAG